jgi:EAL domain-containing protein (putative c-di-GMP-specific phosphodiesterase class I)/ActR/RegA family two-component response regulator
MSKIAAPAPHGKAGARAVYVLDDDARVRSSVVYILADGGYQPVEFSEPAPMLEQLKLVVPEIIVLDLALGKSDAVDVMRHLVDLKFAGKILLISGRDEITLNEIQGIGERHGLSMLPSLRKPFRAVELTSRLSSRTVAVDQAPTRTPGEKITVDLLTAIDSGWLELWYQPKIDLRSFVVCGAEALLRARHPVHEILTPAALIPPAGSVLHQPLAKFVIRRTMQDWRFFAGCGMPLKLAINMPVSVINAPDFMSSLREQLPTDTQFPGLIIEVTEDEVIRDLQWIREVSTQLKLYDVGISVDDFGTAHSSLSRLLELPCVELKLDRSFVANCAFEPLKYAVCQTVVDLAHRVGSRVCAEGVEKVEDLMAVIRMGCDTAQGYIFAKAMPPGSFATDIIARRAELAERFAHLAQARQTTVTPASDRFA